MQKSKFKLYYTHNPIKEIFVMGIKLGLAGLGAFGTVFAPLFASHPLVDAIYLCDAEAEKIKQNAENPAVRTFVVSWKEAAERKESVWRAALVIPRSIGSPVARRSSVSPALILA